MNDTKSTVDDIRRRFDADVKRFSNLETGRQAAVDSPQCLDLISEAAAICSPDATMVLDIGCGAGNYTLKLIEARRKSGHPTDLDCERVDLSQPMLDRARQRVVEQTKGRVETIRQDVRDLTLPDEPVDLILAAAVFHHMRHADEWTDVFGKLYRWLRPGGSVWIYNMFVSLRAASCQVPQITIVSPVDR